MVCPKNLRCVGCRFAFFGEIAVTAPLGSVRTSTIISITVVNLQRLTRDALEDVANIFPNVLVSIRKVAVERRKEIGEDNRVANSLAVRAIPRLWRWRYRGHGSSSQVCPGSARSPPGKQSVDNEVARAPDETDRHAW